MLLPRLRSIHWRRKSSENQRRWIWTTVDSTAGLDEIRSFVCLGAGFAFSDAEIYGRTKSRRGNDSSVFISPDFLSSLLVVLRAWKVRRSEIFIEKVERWIFFRSRYYFAFIFSEMINNASGLGFRAATDDWNLLTNVKPLALETSTSLKSIIDNWNIRKEKTSNRKSEFDFLVRNFSFFF